MLALLLGRLGLPPRDAGPRLADLLDIVDAIWRLRVLVLDVEIEMAA